MVTQTNKSQHRELQALVSALLSRIPKIGQTKEIIEECLQEEKEYTYTSVETKTETKKIRNIADLEAVAPVGDVVDISANINNQSALYLEWRVVGIHRLQSIPKEIRSKSESCSEVTHIISATYHGAFNLFEGTKNSAKGAIETSIVDGSGTSETHEESIVSDGHFESCQNNQISPYKPPKGCGSIVEVELLKLNIIQEEENEQKEQSEPLSIMKQNPSKTTKKQWWNVQEEEYSPPNKNHNFSANFGIYNFGLGLHFNVALESQHEIGIGLSTWPHFTQADIKGNPLFITTPEVDLSYRYYWNEEPSGVFTGFHIGGGVYQLLANINDQELKIANGNLLSYRLNIGYRLISNSINFTIRTGYAGFEYFNNKTLNTKEAEDIFSMSGPIFNAGSLDFELSVGFVF